MNHPWIIHGFSMNSQFKTDIAFVTQWHAMEIERLSTRWIYIVFRRASFSFSKKKLRRIKCFRKPSSNFTTIITNKNIIICFFKTCDYWTNIILFIKCRYSNYYFQTSKYFLFNYLKDYIFLIIFK